MLLATVDSLRRTKVVESLLTQRMIRKYQNVLEIWRQVNKDWNQVLYSMAAYVLCAPRNSVPAQRLAQVVPYTAVLRERSSRQRVEALLLGASGLLEEEYYETTSSPFKTTSTTWRASTPYDLCARASGPRVATILRATP